MSKTHVSSRHLPSPSSYKLKALTMTSSSSVPDLLTRYPVTEDGKEHGEVDWTGGFRHHGFKLGLSGPCTLTKGIKCSSDVIFGDESILILIDEIESL
ncbi:UNVERIFIED_CONTAM: hypothetical protein NCL1_17414 [Trichonephila clavipes]